MPTLREKFLASMRIGSPRNRYSVLTGIAHDMSKTELERTLREVQASSKATWERLKELKAPKVIVDRAEQSTISNPISQLIVRILKTKS